MTTSRKVVIYTRVSSIGQVDNTSLETQEEKCRLYAAAYGHEVVEVIVDAAESGKDTVRPGLQKAREMIATKQVSGVIIAKLDRLSRDQADLFTMVKEFSAKKAALISVHDQLDTSTAQGGILLSVLAMVAEMERQNIIYRVRTSAAAKKSKGERWGKTHFGKRVGDDGKKLVNDEREQATISLARDLREQGLSMQAIATKLDEAGHRARNGKVFVPMQVKRMLAA